jgi:hypothetical protein
MNTPETAPGAAARLAVPLVINPGSRSVPLGLAGNGLAGSSSAGGAVPGDGESEAESALERIE